MAANQVDFKILPSDQFSVYSPATRSDKVITYFTLLSKLRGDILSVGQEDDPNNIVSAFYINTGNVQTLHLVKADGSEVTASNSFAGTVTSVDMSVPTGFSISGNPITTSGTLAVGFASGYSLPTDAIQATWTTAYNRSLTSAAVTGTSTKTLTLNQQDGGTITASWSDIDTGLTSVGLTMPAAFSVANSPLTANGTLAVTAAGLSSQYIRGDGQLANFPTPGGGGSSVNYYLNGSVSQGTFGGDTYYELSKTPIAGAGTNFTRAIASGDGYIASFITDANDPDQINIPGGNFNLEFYFNSSSSGGSPAFYGELYKVSVSNVFTLIASGSANSEVISGGTAVDQYYTSIAVPQTALLATDRLAIRVYVIVDGRNITLHTENSNFSEVITTFSTGLNSLNGLSDQVQYFAVGTTGTDFAISSSLDTHTFNLPTASATNRGALSSADWTTFNGKASDAFKTIAVTGQSDIVADNATDTLNIVAGSGVTLTTNATTDTLTISATGSGGTVTSVDMSVPTGFAISGNPITTSGTLAVAFAAGYSLPTNTSQTNWNTAYNDSITAFAYNTSTAVLTLTQQDAGTLTATVTLQPFSTSNLAEGTNLYYTDVRARLALGAGTGISYNTTTGVITNSAPDQTVVLTAGTGITTSGTYPSFTITNSAPDQTVSLTGAGTTTISGTYPSFTITSNDQFVGTVTSVGLTASTGISVSGSPITTSGSITVTNTAPDQVVVLTASTGISTSGTYPNFTVTNTAPDQTVVLTAGTGISTSGTYPSFTITNSAPDQVVSLTGAGTTTITGTYPNFTISSDDQYDGTVTSVNLTAGARIEVSGGPITTSGSITVTHGTSGGADVATAQSFRLRVIADGGTFEAFNDVAIAIGSLEDIATPQDTDNSGGTVLQNVVLDEFGHLLGVGSITLDTDEIIEGSTNLYFTNTRARSALSAGTGITYDTSTGIITNSAPDQVVVLTAGTGITTSGTYPSFTITNSAPDQTVVLTAGTGITTSGTYPSFTVTNSAPDQVVSLTGAGTTTISGTYPSFTITSSDQFVGTVTSVNLTASTGISVSGGPITTSGSITVTNTAPDQTVVLTAGTGISTSGTYPSFTVTNSAPDQTVVLTASTGITTSGTYPNFTIANSAPDQTVVLTGGTGITTSGTYPNFTVTNSAPDQTVVLTAGTGITTSGTYPNFTVTNAAPDQTVAITAGTGISVSGTYPNFTVTNSSPSSGGTVTSVAALTLGTTGTDLSSTVVNGTTTPVITLNVPTASAANRGALSSTDWTTFNSKQGAITLTTTGSTGAATFVSNTLNIPNYTDQFVGTVTSVNLTAGTRIEVAGGPITTSGSITVTHGVAAGADFTTAQTFEARVLADGGIFEALGEVAIAIGSLEDAASPSSTDFNDGVVIQNVAIDEFGHLLGVGATDLDERYVQNLTAGTGITVSGSPSSTAGLITVTNSDRGSSQNIFKNIAVAGQTTIVADTNDDTLTIVAGTGISVTTNHTTDTLTITNTTASFIPVFAGYSSGGVTLATDATVYDFKIDTETIIDSSIYSHSTSVDSEEITVLSDGTYEITYSGVLFNANTNTSAAAVVDFKVFKNGVVLDDPLNTAQNVAHLNTSNYNYINQISNSYIVELLNNDIIKLTISAAYQGGGSPSPAVKFGFQGSAKNNLTIKKLY